MYIVYIYIYIYIYIINLRTAAVSLFESASAQLRPNGFSKDPSAQTTTGVVCVAYCLWLPFLIRSVLNLKKVKERDIRSICGQLV